MWSGDQAGSSRLAGMPPSPHRMDHDLGDHARSRARPARDHVARHLLADERVGSSLLRWLGPLLAAAAPDDPSRPYAEVVRIERVLVQKDPGPPCLSLYGHSSSRRPEASRV